MGKIKALYNFLDTLFLGIWGLTIIDLIPLLQVDFFQTIDGWVKTLMALVGFIYFLIKIPHNIKMQKLDRKIKEEELEKLERENNKSKQSKD